MKNSSKSLTRRVLLKNAGLAAGAGLVAPVLSAAAAGAQVSGSAHANSSKRALVLCSDRSHNADVIRMALGRLFKDLNMPVDFTIEYEKLSRSLLSNYQLFVAFRNGVTWPDGYPTKDDYTPPGQKPPVGVAWMTDEQAQAVQDFVKAGNGLYAYHNSDIMGTTSKIFRELIGGNQFLGHPPIRPFRVRPTANKHPITDGITEFWVEDEQHYVAYDKDPKYIILEAENMDGIPWIQRPNDLEATVEIPPGNYGTKSISGYAYDYGNGRVVYTAVGHTFQALWTPQYYELQKRSVKWLLKEL
jgi:hypothetical protein